jgi:AcrR family transcriptional regulator
MATPDDHSQHDQRQPPPPMTTTQRADARRNYEKLVAAARDAFAQDGASASLEDIARQAEVGIGTLYRHFPCRQDLFQSVYASEVEALCQSAHDVAELPPWDGLVSWLHQFIRYIATKRAIAEELIASIGRDSELFRSGRAAIYAAGGPLLERAPLVGVARTDTSIDDVMRLISGITMIHFADPGQIDRVLGLALDGLRYGPALRTV